MKWMHRRLKGLTRMMAGFQMIARFPSCQEDELDEDEPDEVVSLLEE